MLRDTVKKEIKNFFLLILKNKTTQNVFILFSAFNVLCIFSDDQVSVKYWFKLLRKCLIKVLTQIQLSKMNIKTLFSAKHFNVFFKLTCDHFAITFNEFFNFINTSQHQNSVSLNLNKYLFNFFSNIQFLYKLTKFTVSMMTFSFHLNNYFFDMHNKLIFILIRTWRLTLQQFLSQLRYLNLSIKRSVMKWAEFYY